MARRLRAIAAIIVGSLLLAGAARAAGRDAVPVGVLRLASSGPVFIGVDQGYFRDAGIDVDLHFFDAAQPVAVAIVSGDVDIGVTAFTAGLYNLAGKGAIKIIAGQAREQPGYGLNAYVVTPRAYDAGFTSLDKFAGKTVGITQTGSSFHYLLGLLADKYKFDIAGVQLVPLQSLPNLAAALRGGQVDGAIMPATVALPLVDHGEARLLGWAGDETPWQINAVFTSAKADADRRPLLTRFLGAYRRATQAFYDAFLVKGADGKPVAGANHDAFAQIIAKYTEQTPAQVLRSLPYVDPKAGLQVDDIVNQVKWFKAQGLVDAGVEAQPMIDLSLLDQAK